MPEAARPAHSILIADSDVLVRGALADYLRDCGYRVVEAASGDEVITLFEQGAISFEAVLIDAELAGTRNAFELRVWLRQHQPDMSVMLAGNVESAARMAGHLCDEGPHLSRPYDPQAVVAHIKRLIARARS
ncbi:MAG: response regulator [Sphingomonadales bacterium]|nr:response regulator [Sphingomonadales bacterium]MDE2168151.1 response regulator [Sphingomonadales bacterium]